MRLAPPYSVIFILPEFGEPPTSFEGTSVAETPTGVGIGTLSELDGETTIHLCRRDDLEPADSAHLTVAWSGTLPTTGHLEVVTAEDTLLTAATGETVRLVVLTNDPDEPDEIWIVLTD